MKIKSILFFVAFLSFCIQSAYGQWDAQISQYWRAKTYFNPSFAADAQNIDISILHRMQWVGIARAPKTSIATANMPLDFLGKTHGVGAQMFNEKIGLFSNTSVSLQYAYKFKFKDKGNLNIGLQAGMVNIDFDASKIHLVSEEAQLDPALPTGGEDKTMDFAFGISWVTPKYYVGLSTTHLLEPSFDLDDTHSSFIGRAYYLVAGYNININNSLFVLQPSTLIKSDAVVTQVDLTARVEYNNMFNGGLSWRKDDGFVFLLGLKIKNIDAGYAYDLSTSEISKASSGSHEFFFEIQHSYYQTESDRQTQKHQNFVEFEQKIHI